MFLGKGVIKSVAGNPEDPSGLLTNKGFGRRSGASPPAARPVGAPPPEPVPRRTSERRQGERRKALPRNGNRRRAVPLPDGHLSAPGGIERRHTLPARAGDRRLVLAGSRDRRSTSGRNDRRNASTALPPVETDRRNESVQKPLPRQSAVHQQHTPLPPISVELDSSPRLKKYQDIIWNTIINTVDAVKFTDLDRQAATLEIMMLVKEITQHHDFRVSATELDYLGHIAADEMLGLGPLEPLLQRDDIDEIMVNGASCVYIERHGIVERTSVSFRDEHHLVRMCQRIVGKVGRHVDESTPICDARLADGSRVNVILPPLALDGTILTIRKFSRERMTLEKLIEIGSVDVFTAELIRIIAACRINVIVSGGTGSGKTTMLNCLTRHIHARERIVTCEDAAELQLQQPHVLRLETRPAGIEGGGAITMRDLVRNCLRMRPERIIIGEVRGAEAFELLSAMSTGHDGSMGTVHANSPRDALGRLENMIAMTSLNLPTQTVRQQIAAAVNVIIQVQRIRDGSRKVVSISEITGMEGDVVALQDLVSFHIHGEDDSGRIVGAFKATGLKPRFFEKLRQYRLEDRFMELMATVKTT